jgi:hypothetical protein
VWLNNILKVIRFFFCTNIGSPAFSSNPLRIFMSRSSGASYFHILDQHSPALKLTHPLSIDRNLFFFRQIFKNLTHFVNGIRIIQFQFSLLDKLHTSNAHNHLRAAGNPEHGFHIHLLRAIDAFLSTCMRQYFISIFVDCYAYYAGDFGWSCGCGRSCRCTCCGVNC